MSQCCEYAFSWGIIHTIFLEVASNGLCLKTDKELCQFLTLVHFHRVLISQICKFEVWVVWSVQYWWCVCTED